MPFAPPVMRMTLSLSCKSMGKFLQVIKANCVAAEDILFLCGSRSMQVIVDDFYHLRVAGCYQTHRPIGTEHQAICAKRVKHDIEVRFEISGSPISPIGFGDETG